MKQNKQLNAFEIKREISRLIKALEKSTILIDVTEFQTLDAQEDFSLLIKILLKEFMLCNEENMPVLKLLLLRYTEENQLLNEMEAIIKTPKNSNNLKLHAIEVISEFNANWQDSGYDSYLDYDEELVQKETQELLECSKENPEIQLDFLDFFSAIAPKDQIMLLESLQEDQNSADLANILVAIFLSFPTEEIGQAALKQIGVTKSTYAYKALSEVFDCFSPQIQQSIKKVLNELKLSGASCKYTSEAQTDAEFYLIPPDGEGNYSLIYKKSNPDQTVQLIGMVIDEYTGIRECLGFGSISEFEATFLFEKLTGIDFKTKIDATMFKKLIMDAEKINYKKSAPPYEYNCWKRIFSDIEPAKEHFSDILKKEFTDKTYTKEDIEEIFNADFTGPWFYTHTFGNETEEFFSNLDKKLKVQTIDEININDFLVENIPNVIYQQEKQNWVHRLQLTALGKLNAGENNCAKTLYLMSQSEKEMDELYLFIMKQSVIQYFLQMFEEENFLKYKQNEVEKNIEYLSDFWGFYV